jgi:hypothetical protein
MRGRTIVGGRREQGKKKEGEGEGELIFCDYTQRSETIRETRRASNKDRVAK